MTRRFQRMPVYLVDVVDGECLFIVGSESRWNHFYEVHVNQHGHTTCDCQDAGFRRKQPQFLDIITDRNALACKHMRRIGQQYRKLQNGK